MKVGVIAGPAGARAGMAVAMQVPHDVAVRIENANFRNSTGSQMLLPTRLAQQALRRKNRWRIVVLARKDRRHS